MGPDGYFSADFSSKPDINTIVFKGATYTVEYSTNILWDMTEMEKDGICVASCGDINIKDVSFGTIS